MKKLIRHSVFETNSSSTHSISVADSTKQFVLETIYPDQDGNITLTGGEFGWEWEKYNDSLSKANYCLVYCKDWSREKEEAHTNTLFEVIKEQTGAENIILSKRQGEYYEHGYIDHQSVESSDLHFLFEDKEQLKNFLFNKNSWLFTGNDNSTADPMFYDVPEFKDGRQILAKYTHELSVGRD